MMLSGVHHIYRKQVHLFVSAGGKKVERTACSLRMKHSLGLPLGFSEFKTLENFIRLTNEKKMDVNNNT